MRQMTFGILVGSRGFFPAHLAKSGRVEMIAAVEAAGHTVVVLSPEETLHGAVQTYEDAKKCAALFKSKASEIDGVIVTLPNFGEERPIADTLRWANLNVPVLIQATPDDPEKMSRANRRDSFCGKMSACNNLRQYGIDYTLTKSHCVAPASNEFAEDLAQFAAVCRISNGMRNLRVYALGGSTTSASLMGVPVAFTTLSIYAISSFTAGLAGIVFSLYTSSGYSLAAVGVELDAIAAVVIGGTVLTGGYGFLLGTFIGVMLQGLVQTYIVFDGTLSSWWTKIVIGFLLFVFILLQRLVFKNASQKN